MEVFLTTQFPELQLMQVLGVEVPTHLGSICLGMAGILKYYLAETCHSWGDTDIVLPHSVYSFRCLIKPARKKPDTSLTLKFYQLMAKTRRRGGFFCCLFFFHL